MMLELFNIECSESCMQSKEHLQRLILIFCPLLQPLCFLYKLLQIELIMYTLKQRKKAYSQHVRYPEGEGF